MTSNVILEIVELLHPVSNNSTLEDRQKHLYALENIRKGQTSIKDDSDISDEEAKARLSPWITK